MTAMTWAFCRGREGHYLQMGELPNHESVIKRRGAHEQRDRRGRRIGLQDVLGRVLVEGHVDLEVTRGTSASARPRRSPSRMPVTGLLKAA
jgi:hypothetical protein